MKKILLSFFLISFLYLGNVEAQSHILCGHELVLETVENQHPGFNEAVRNTFDQAKQKGALTRNASSVYTIPVVVHVVWKDAEENLADSIILNQIAGLNADYRRMNADAADVRADFLPVVGDPMVEFQLEQIVRVNTTNDFEPSLTGLPDEVKNTSMGGSDSWDTQNYMNIWICELQPLTLYGIPLGQILGYAYPPAGLSNWPAGSEAPSADLEGIVVDYRTVGSNNPNPIDVGTGVLDIRGRTMTHEVGHYLGLRHIWGDGGGLLGGDSCGDDDGVLDTPNSGSQANFDCDFTRNTCDAGAPGDMIDMIENFMDYSAESCMNSFTQGQIDIVRGVLEGPRADLPLESSTSTQNFAINKNDLSIFPNPSTGFIQIDLLNEEGMDYQVTVKNLLGQTVKEIAQSNARAANYTADLNHLSNGMYLIEVRTAENAFAEKLMISK